MPKKLEYDVFTDECLAALIETVNSALGEGWRPQGGICAQRRVFKDCGGYTESETIFYQAVVRDMPEGEQK